MNAPRATAVIIDPTTGKDIAEPNPFHNPKSLDKEQGYCPSSIRPLNPKPVILKNRKGKELATEKPFFWNEVTGQREYEDKRQPARRIASDAQGNPLTFATKPGESVSKRIPHSILTDMVDYDDDDPASMVEQSILRRRK